MIARMWLEKARKRRAFFKLVKPIIDSKCGIECEVCSRNPLKHGVRLLVHLTTDGVPDPNAIDKLISGFEVMYNVKENNPSLWQAFFRAHAEYMTRCSICEDSKLQPEAKLELNDDLKVGITRAEDISSDEESEDGLFEPLVVTRNSPEGRMMSKWLLAARKKLGGLFPRQDARRQMEKYAQKLRQLKLKKTKESIQQMGKVGSLKDEETGRMYDSATTAMAQRWIKMARDSIDSKFRMKSEILREDLDFVLGQMRPQDDWYYTLMARTDGQNLLREVQELENRRRTAEAEAAVKIHKFELDLHIYLKDIGEELDRERENFEKRIAQQSDRINLDIEIRGEELKRVKEEKKIKFAGIERLAAQQFGAAPTELIQTHRNLLIDIENLIITERNNMLSYRDNEANEARKMFQSSEDTKITEINKRKKLARENIIRIRKELSERIRAEEMEWQSKASKWLMVAKRKVEVKKQEDELAKAGKLKRGGVD